MVDSAPPESRGIMRNAGCQIRIITGSVIRIMLGSLLLLSGIGKLQNSYAFLATLDQYQLVGPKLATNLAVVLPFLELTAGACLVVGLARRAAFILAMVLFAVFGCALASVVYRQIHTTCGCFGALESSDVTWATVGRTVAFFGLAAAGLWAASSNP